MVIIITRNGGEAMDKRVVVENTLESYISFLEDAGYDVHKLYKNENVNSISSFDYDGIVISDSSSLSLSHTEGNRPSAPIIEAKGKTPEEVFNILRSRY